MKGGVVERKLALALVRSFFALSIRDNFRFLSLPCLGNYHWLRTIRLLRLQKTNSSLAPLPLGSRVRSACSRPYGLRTPYRAVTRFAAKMRSPVALQAAKSLPALGDGVSGRAAQNVSEYDLP